MGNFGYVRRIDDMGRIVIPIDIRRKMGLDEYAPLEVTFDGEMLHVKKHAAVESCVGSVKALIETVAEYPEKIKNNREITQKLNEIIALLKVPQEEKAQENAQAQAQSQSQPQTPSQV